MMEGSVVRTEVFEDIFIAQCLGTDMYQGMQIYKYCGIFIFLKQTYFSLSHLYYF